jgi:hypothetical protein
MPFPKGRLLKRVTTDKGLFDHDYWCDRRVGPVEPVDMFGRFLRDYDLIGMPKARIEELLGEPAKWRNDTASITCEFPNSNCLPSFFGVRIYIVNERAVSWSFVESNPTGHGNEVTESDRMTTNVVLNRSVNSHYSDKRKWPVVEPKYPSQEAKSGPK